MKTLIIIFPKGKEVNNTYKLPEGMNGENWMRFKRDYEFILNRLIIEAKIKKLPVIKIELDELPVLIDDVKMLKSYMSGNLVSDGVRPVTVKDWNRVRNDAKELFTAPCIGELDGSGYINKCIIK